MWIFVGCVYCVSLITVFALCTAAKQADNLLETQTSLPVTNNNEHQYETTDVLSAAA